MRTELLYVLAPHLAQKVSLSEAHEGVYLQAAGGTVLATSVGRYGHTGTSGGCPWSFDVRVSAEALVRALRGTTNDIDYMGVDDKNRLEVVLGRQTVRLPTYPTPEWPAPPALKNSDKSRLDREGLLAVAGASDETEARQTCNGIQVADGWMFATDSYRLHAAKTTLPGTLRIPQTIEAVLRSLSGGVVSIEVDERLLRLTADGFEHVTPLLTKPPIKWAALLREPSVFLEFDEEDAMELLFALKHTAKLTQSPAILEVKDACLRLSTVDEMSSFSLRDDDDFPLRIGFNCGSILEAIQFVGWDGALTLEMIDAKSPIAIRGPERLALVMPVRV